MLSPALIFFRILGTGTRLHPPAFGGSPIHKGNAPFVQGRRPAGDEFRLELERFNHRQDDDGDQQDCRYLIDDTKEFLRVPVLISAEILHHGAE